MDDPFLYEHITFASPNYHQGIVYRSISFVNILVLQSMKLDKIGKEVKTLSLVSNLYALKVCFLLALH